MKKRDGEIPERYAMLATAGISTAVAALRDRQRLNPLGRAARSKAESLEWERVIHGVEQRLFEAIERHSYPGGRHEIMAATTK